MSKAAATTPVPEPEFTLEDDIAEPEAEELTLDAGPEDEPEDDPPPRSGGMANMVPVEQLNVERQRRETAEAVAAQLARAGGSGPAVPATPRRLGLVDPNASPEKQKWQREVEELLLPQIEAIAAAQATPAAAIALRSADAADLDRMRGLYEDYDEVADEVERLRGPFMQQAGNWLPREEFYFAIVGRRSRTGKARTTRAAAVRRATAPARTANQPPAQGRRPQIRVTKDTVGKLSLAQMEALLEKSNVPLLR